ncbi:insulin-like [Clarias gariepinus]|uniref:insulin-like n=1 Tax=Clarias gariepinus TaxID=13013 RepID=UPI00234C935A|nr:insulin-like [Clarias gariepinus]
MRVWLQAGVLLLLLVISSAAPEDTERQQLCGGELVDALDFVCGSGRFLFRRKDQKDKSKSIVEQCCFKSCSLRDLQNFCS